MDKIVGEKENGKIWVRSTIKKRGAPDETKEDSDLILVDDFDAPHVRVKLTIGLTKQLRDYESVRVDVGIEVPCYKPEIKNALLGMEELVTSEVARIVAAALKVG